MTEAPYLAPAEALYAFGMRRRRRAMLGRRKGPQSPCPVISVGNLSVGGTGKTPMAQWVARLLQQHGLKVSVVSRGYGGSLSDSGAIVSDGITSFLAAAEAGDESMLHARGLPGVAVVIGKDRHLAVRRAVDACGAQVVVLDDGFQFWSLDRDLDIVLLDAAAPFTNGHLLPRGRLREEPAALQRAGAIVLSRAAKASQDQLQTAKIAIAKYSQAPIFEADHAALDLWDEAKHQSVPLETLNGQRVSAVAAIAGPGPFFDLLRAQGVTIGEELVRRDHHHWTRSDFAALPKRNQMVICTEKDAVKLEPSWFGGRLLSLRITIDLHGGEADLGELILSKLKAAT